MKARWRVEHLVSSGGVVYRTGKHGVEVVLCGRTSPRMWGLPKGTPTTGETLEETALREVSEETGLDVESEGPVDQIAYWFVRVAESLRYHKQVHFYLMHPLGGSFEQHDPEFDEVQWFPGEEALRVLTYANEARIVEKALALVQERLQHDRINPTG